jgi:hypothetical protein
MLYTFIEDYNYYINIAWELHHRIYIYICTTVPLRYRSKRAMLVELMKNGKRARKLRSCLYKSLYRNYITYDTCIKYKALEMYAVCIL